MAECRAGGCSPGPSLPPDPRHSARHRCPLPRCGAGKSGGTELEKVARRLVAGNGSPRPEEKNHKASESQGEGGGGKTSLQ